MPEEKTKVPPDWLPSIDEWIARSAESPDDFEAGERRDGRIAAAQEHAREEREPE